MTAIAKDRTGVEINEEALQELRKMSGRSYTEEVENKFSSRTEKRVTYYMNGLDVCTLIWEQGRVVEIQGGLLGHPIVGRLSN